jgi:hypothetical protein
MIRRDTMKGKQSARIPVAIYFPIILAMAVFSGCGEPRVERIQVTPAHHAVRGADRRIQGQTPDGEG